MRGTRYTACYPVSNAIQTVCSIRSLQDFYSNTGQQVIDKDQNRAEKQELSQRAASKRKKIKKSSSLSCSLRSRAQWVWRVGVFTFLATHMRMGPVTNHHLIFVRSLISLYCIIEELAKDTNVAEISKHVCLEKSRIGESQLWLDP